MSNLGKRIALGNRLGFDVDEPNELIREADGSPRKLPNGDTITRRDGLGLAIDPALYAKRSCRTCHGRGVLILQRPVPSEMAARMRADPTAAALLHDGRKGQSAVRETERCLCAVLGYAKAVTAFTAALLKEGLARRIGWAKENIDALAREQIELIP